MTVTGLPEVHQVVVTGPVRYPGGKDGWFVATCSCGKYGGSWGPTEAQARKPAQQHKEAKERNSGIS